MGFNNDDRVWGLVAQGRLTKPRGNNPLTDSFSLSVLLYMAHNTYDWPPDGKLKRLRVPCRLYTRGWRSISEAMALTAIDADKLANATEEEAEAMMETRENNAKGRISKAWAFLREQGLIKKIDPQRPGMNAAFLLLLGDDEENRACEAWARECLQGKR
ncbi:hypothetical protein [Bifidobacterium oedipodis]|nr:hypothetical protein [Bifidobacterium sp. DSM 109957]